MEYSKDFEVYSKPLLKAKVLKQVLVKHAAMKTAEDKFKYTQSLFMKYKMVRDVKYIKRAFQCCISLKDTKIRICGNEQFREKKYELAINTYTVCLMKGTPGTLNYALTFANRSAALFELSMYSSCMTDVQRAIDTKMYPSELLYKLYMRAGNANRLMGHSNLAKMNYEECLKHLVYAAMSKRQKTAFKTDVLNFIDMCNNMGNLNYLRINDQLPELLGGPNEQIPAFSKFLELRCTTNMGRGVYTTRDLNPGDTVAIDSVYICRPSLDSLNLCCYSRCLEVNWAVIPCPNCRLLVYCNEECMQKSYVEDAHNLECPTLIYAPTLPGKTMINLLVINWFFKAISQMGLDKYCSIVHDFSKTKLDLLTRGFNGNGQYISDEFLTNYSLYNDENNISSEVSFFFSCIATNILHCIIKRGMTIPKHQIVTVGASFLHMVKLLSSNAIKFRTSWGRWEEVFARGLYPSICLFNHSCDANVTSYVLDKKTVVLKTLQPISKGSQLCISYGLNFQNNNKQWRDLHFKNVLKFKCLCQPCIENWPTIRYTPNRLSTHYLLNPNMAYIVSLECKKFLEFQNTVAKETNFHEEEHLTYLINFAKFLFINVKRPFKLYEDCIDMLFVAQKTMLGVHKESPDVKSIINYFVRLDYL
ncbi:Zinc finger, MYND-type,Tetratricopeptide-like helical domain,SET domain [Cinara cedri]|uniref:Zinc finger, MYND-type,Tetratricopeptide-like helical domain,SET domain n=1 Tax=Cinara cedri TaxID=506608 RepID=A0A5E4MK40_9HEMI|nr:Zinc finger, MYND-type,Tetratricopeptide-like helical domain,SET domain [Cinara cedri]